jgi:hypothetical protein
LATAAVVSPVSAKPNSPLTDTPAAELKREVRHETVMARLAERREVLAERREARLDKLAALHAARGQFTPATFVEMPGASVMTSASARPLPTGSTAAMSGLTPALPPLPIVSGPATVSGTAAGSGAATSGTTTSAITEPTPDVPIPVVPTSLPDAVSVMLATIYEEYESGELSTTAHPGQVEIQGSSVGVQIKTMNSDDFAAMVTAVENLGLQVQIVDPAYDIVTGFLPIAELPAAAQVAGAPIIAPLLYPALSSS